MTTPRPKQLPLPFGKRAERQEPEAITRLRRIEARLVQLMKHVGMKDDGRASLPEDQTPKKEN